MLSYTQPMQEANAEEEALRQAALGDLSAASPAMHPAKHPQAVPIVYQTPTTEVRPCKDQIIPSLDKIR